MLKGLVPFVVAACLVGMGMPARADGPVGSQSPSFGSAVVNPPHDATGEKPEHKLFYTRDDSTQTLRWWAVLGLAKDITPQGLASSYTSPGVYVLEYSDGGWIPRFLLEQSDPWAKADTLYDPVDHSLLVSLRDNKTGTTTNPRISTLHRLSNDGAGTWSEPGSPLTITKANPETVTIARDSVGRIWTTFEQGANIKVGYLLPGGSVFKFLRISLTTVTPDDISAVVAFGTSQPRIGVLWSDETAERFWFAWRSDTAKPSAASFTSHLETAYGGDQATGCPLPAFASTSCADDHIHLAANGDTVYASVKTSLNDTATANASDPLIVLLTRASDAWSSTAVSPVSANYTRPIIVLDATDDTLYLLATVLKGETSLWQTSLSTPNFTSPVLFETWTANPACQPNNVTSTRQPVDASTGLIAMTSTSKCAYTYWTNTIPPASV